MSGHVAPVRLYVAVFLALMVLTLVTVWVSRLDLGLLNLPAAISIAVVKATIVILYFMHVKWSNHLVKVSAASGFAFFLILVALTLSDYLSRNIIGLGK